MLYTPFILKKEKLNLKKTMQKNFLTFSLLFFFLLHFLIKQLNMETNDYWALQNPLSFANIDWGTTGQDLFMGYDEKLVAPYPPPFQRRRSSSVDLPVNPLYLNKVINEPTIIEEDDPFNKLDKNVN